MQETEKKEKKSRSLFTFLASQFLGYSADDEHNSEIEDTPVGLHHASPFDAGMGDSGGDDSGTNRDRLDNQGFPVERENRLNLYTDMASDPVISEAINMHISHALSPDNRTGKIFKLEPTSPEWAPLVDELNNSIIAMINENVTAWTQVTCEYGVNYIRPHAEEGVGITHFEANYYTLPHFTREYERRGRIAGYTNQHLKDNKKGSAVTLAPPWALIPLKIPYFTPNPLIEPKNTSGTLYSLTNDDHFQSIIETQNYGTSFLYGAYEPWRDLRDAIDSLRGSRHNASRIDRFITASLADLDVVQAANYMNLIAETLQEAKEEADRQSARNKSKPTILNSIIPTMQDGKGGVNIDTQSTDPNIQHIEDILFHLKRLAAALGIDVSMLGWADSLSGGLGEGGYFQTAIQAARRAVWIRVAVERMVDRACDLHLWYRDKKAIPQGTEKPWRVAFNAMNTAIEEQENLARESNANFGTIVATLVDAIDQGATSKSPTLTKLLLGKVVEGDSDQLNTILQELASAASNDSTEDDDMFASVDKSTLSKDAITYLVNELMKMEEPHD